MAIRTIFYGAAAAALLLAGCDEQRTGPIVVSAIGSPPRLINPNLKPLDPPTAFLAQAIAQGLVRFDATGQIEPALAQSWIVSDDGLRYTFRLARDTWPDGKPVTAEQVTGRLRAAISRASRNPLKIQLGAIDQVEAMTGDVIEIRLKGPRPNFLQLLAQPEMAIISQGRGTGPYRAERQPDGSYLLSVSPADDEDPESALPPIILRGERAGLAVARFAARQADLVIGGTGGDLPVARAADLPATALHFEPVSGLFGLAFVRRDGPLGDAAVRRALAMALDREALLDDVDVPNLRPRETIVAEGIDELPEPAVPDWTGIPVFPPTQRRSQAAQAIAAAIGDAGPLRVRVAIFRTSPATGSSSRICGATGGRSESKRSGSGRPEDADLSGRADRPGGLVSTAVRLWNAPGLRA